MYQKVLSTHLQKQNRYNFSLWYSNRIPDTCVHGIHVKQKIFNPGLSMGLAILILVNPVVPF